MPMHLIYNQILINNVDSTDMTSFKDHMSVAVALGKDYFVDFIHSQKHVFISKGDIFMRLLGKTQGETRASRSIVWFEVVEVNADGVVMMHALVSDEYLSHKDNRVIGVYTRPEQPFVKKGRSGIAVADFQNRKNTPAHMFKSGCFIYERVPVDKLGAYKTVNILH